MRTKMSVLVAGLGLLLAAVPVAAHHAFDSEFDAKKHVDFRGTVTKMEWIIPHAWIHVDVKKRGRWKPGRRTRSSDVG